jgi:hypothetical protein
MTWKPGPDNSGTYDHVSAFLDGSPLGSWAAGTTEAAVAGSLSAAWTLRETDLAGNESAETKLKPVPPIVGLSPEDAAATLEGAGFHAGTVTEGGVGPVGTVTGPAGLVLAEEGATIDLTVASGNAGSSTKFAFGIVSAPRAKVTQPTLGARVKLTRAARVTGVLYGRRNLKLYTWRFALHAGRSIVKLRLPSQVRRPGVYRIRWTAKSGRDSISRTVKLRLVGSSRGLGPVVDPRAPRVEVVLAGGNLQKGIALQPGPKGARFVSAGGVDAAFDLAAASSRNVRVIVVDVDEFGVGFVRDLHVVFPSVRIVALSGSRARLAAAKRVGAAVVLPRSTSSRTLAKVVGQLLKRR